MIATIDEEGKDAGGVEINSEKVIVKDIKDRDYAYDESYDLRYSGSKKTQDGSSGEGNIGSSFTNMGHEREQDTARDFYLVETIKNKWSTRELDRQINSMLFDRVALSKDKKGVKKLAKKGQELIKPSDAIKDPYVLEFLDIKESEKLSEKELESALIDLKTTAIVSSHVSQMDMCEDV